jgi:hypothetical protein
MASERGGLLAAAPTAETKAALRAWPGLDVEFQRHVKKVAGTEEGLRFRNVLVQELAAVRAKRSPIGLPELVRRQFGAELRRFGRAYHRAIEVVTRAWRGSPDLRRLVHLPPELQKIVDASIGMSSSRVHLARLDLLLQPCGGFRVVETNANCPGALLSCGIAGRRWRALLEEHGLVAPVPLEYETPEWMASWLIRTAEEETGVAPELFVLLREEGGNRLELPGLAAQLRSLGVETLEADPRELTALRSGYVTLRGRTVLHAYWKVGIPELLRMLPRLERLVRALQERRLFVQNGFGARFIADNKLCLAALSDPRFDALFDPADLAIIRPRLPWSRNLALCTPAEIKRIRCRPEDYVLKRPLDTRGRGVVIGREVTSSVSWRNAVNYATEEEWLVQRFCVTTGLVDEAGPPSGRLHDLSLGLTNGRLVGAVIRSSRELRTNVALSGSAHPVFFA